MPTHEEMNVRGRNQMNPGNGTETSFWLTTMSRLESRNQMNPGNGTETDIYLPSTSNYPNGSQSNESRQRD